MRQWTFSKMGALIGAALNFCRPTTTPPSVKYMIGWPPAHTICICRNEALAPHVSRQEHETRFPILMLHLATLTVVRHGKNAKRGPNEHVDDDARNASC